MQPNEFTQSRQADWQQLTSLLEKGEKSSFRLTPAEIDNLGRLYRSATSDLALAQRDFPRIG